MGLFIFQTLKLFLKSVSLRLSRSWETCIEGFPLLELEIMDFDEPSFDHCGKQARTCNITPERDVNWVGGSVNCARQWLSGDLTLLGVLCLATTV